MNKSVAIKLREKVLEVAKNFSDSKRKFNGNAETFKIGKIISLGDDLACVEFNKSSGKKALAVFVHVPGMNYWTYFFPNASHLLGWEKIRELYLSVEEHNFGFNFEEKKLEEFV